MSTPALEMKAYTDPANENNSIVLLGMFNLPIDVLLSIARYMHYDDLENFAVTCQYANALFQRYLSYDKFKSSVLPEVKYLQESCYREAADIKLATPLMNQSLTEVVDSIMSNDGRWLFVLRCTSTTSLYCLDLFENTSTTAMQYQHRKRHHVMPTQNLLGPYLCIVGIDANDANPGVFLTDYISQAYQIGDVGVDYANTRQIYSCYYRDSSSKALAHKIGERLPFTTIAVESCGDQLKIHGIDKNRFLSVQTRTRDGRRLSETRSDRKLKPGDYELKLSPNGKTLVIQDNDSGIVCLVRNLKVCKTMQFPNRLPSHYCSRISVTNDMGTLVVWDTVIPLDSISNRPRLRRLQYSGSITAHSGDGRFMLSFTGSKRVSQIFTQPRYFSCAVEQAYEALVSFTQPDYYLRLHELLSSSEANQAMKVIQRAHPFRHPTILFRFMVEVIGRTLNESLLFCISDAITLMEIMALSRDPYLAKLPKTGLVELALSPKGQALGQLEWGTAQSLEALKDWFNHPIVIHTEHIGIIDSSTFLWGSTPFDGYIEHRVTDHYCREYDPRQKFREFFPLRHLCYSKHPLVFFSSRVDDDKARLIDVACQSRKPLLDKTRHKLIPSGIRQAIEGLPSDESRKKFINYLLLDALLKKLIAWTQDPDHAKQLSDSRYAMLKAVESNPSLRYEMRQLLTTHFYGQECIAKCLEQSPFYKDFCTLFAEELVLEEELHHSFAC